MEIQAVFRSGQGAQREQTLPAEIVAVDSSDQSATPVALLEVRGVKRTPTPLNVEIASATEGMSYIGAGFPLGGMLSKFNDNRGNPSVTITRGRIAALRRDAHGQLDLFQTDGSLQPGNMGGPIVEQETGKLIGVAVATVSVDTIGFVMPTEYLRRTLAGRLGPPHLRLKAMNANSALLDVRTDIVDPRHNIQDVFVHVRSATASTVRPNSDGSWPLLTSAAAVELQRDPQRPSASGSVQVGLSGEGAAKRKILVQTAHSDIRGQIVYSGPREYNVPDEPGPIHPTSTPGNYEARVLALLSGEEKPADNAERLLVAQLCYDMGRYAGAARFWDEALALDHKLGDGRTAQHRYNAACAAALAGCGLGKDNPKPDQAARGVLRAKARGWLSEELAAWAKIADSMADAISVAPILEHWKLDLDLAGVRDADALAELPEDERRAWQVLWTDVDALLEKAKGK